MNAQTKFLTVAVLVFSMTIMFRLAPGAAFVELIVLLIFVYLACRASRRR